jgi:leucyl aminopeptidase
MSSKHELIQPDRGQQATAIHLVSKAGFADFAKGLNAQQRAALAGQKFTGAGYQVGIVPDGDGWFAVGGVRNPAALSSWCLAKLAEDLPAGSYRLAEGEPAAALHGWQTAQYRFTRYREDSEAQGPARAADEGRQGRSSRRWPRRARSRWCATWSTRRPRTWGRPNSRPRPRKLAKAYAAKLSVTKGESLEREYPMVTRSAARPGAAMRPRMLHLTWGDENRRRWRWSARACASIRAGSTSNRPRACC